MNKVRSGSPLQDACLPSKLLKWLPVKRKCPWQVQCPHITHYIFHHVAHYIQPAQTSFYLNWPAVCYVTVRWKERKCCYVSARDAADDMWGRERPRLLSERGRSFHFRSRHHTLPSAVTPLIHYLSAATACLPDHVMWAPVHMDYLSRSVSFYPPSCCRSNPRFRSITLMQCVIVCFCVERFSQILSHKHMRNASCSPETNH